MKISKRDLQILADAESAVSALRAEILQTWGDGKRVYVGLFGDERSRLCNETEKVRKRLNRLLRRCRGTD